MPDYWLNKMSIIGAQQEPRPWFKRIFAGGPAAASTASAQETLTPGRRSLAGGVALALMGGILANQAEQVAQFGSNNQQRDLFHDFLTFISRVIGTVSTPLTSGRALVSDLARKEQSSLENPNKTELANKIEQNYPDLKKYLGPKLGWLNNILDPRIAGSIGSLIFSYENMASSFFLEKPEGENTKIASAWEAFFPPLAKFTSLLGSVLSLPGYASAAIFRFGNTFNNNNIRYKAANFIARLGDVFQPVSANLNAFYKTLMSFKLARTTGMSQAQANGHYGINGAHILQGVVGSLLAIPSLFGSFSRFRKIFGEGEQQKMISQYLSGFTTKLREVLQKIGEKYNIKTLAKIDLDQTSSQIEGTVNNTISNCKSWMVSGVESICNMPLVKDLMRKILPYDASTDRITLSARTRTEKELEEMAPERREALEQIQKDPQNKIKGFINKTTVIEELDHITRPIQSLLMLLPSAIPRISDPDIQAQGNWLMKSLDVGLGLASAFLGLPSFMVYACSTRVPKIIAMVYGQRQKYALAKGNFSYNAMDELVKLQEKLLNSKWIPFARFIGRALDRIIHDKELGANVFHHESSYLELLNRLEKEAQSQERHVKTVTSLDVSRRFLKTLILNPITSKIFKTSVPVGELSQRDKGKQQVYNLLTRVETVIRGLIPGLGGIIAIPLTLIKKFFYVRTEAPEDPMQKQLQAAMNMPVNNQMAANRIAPALKQADAAHLIPSMSG